MPECIFCGVGDAKLTKEHVLPEWISRALLGSRPPGDTFVTDATDTHGAYSMRTINLSPKVLCVPCNTKWMSDLDDAASTILKPLIAGKGRSLSMRQQTVIATWAMTKFMVAEYLVGDEADNYFQADERRAIRERGTMPFGSGVWLARYVGKNAAVSRGEVHVWGSSELPGVQVPGIASCHGAGHLLILLIAHRFLERQHGMRRVSIQLSNVGGLLPIWPLETRQKWPPHPPFGEAQVDSFFASLDQPITSVLKAPPDEGVVPPKGRPEPNPERHPTEQPKSKPGHLSRPSWKTKQKRGKGRKRR